MASPGRSHCKSQNCLEKIFRQDSHKRGRLKPSCGRASLSVLGPAYWPLEVAMRRFLGWILSAVLVFAFSVVASRANAQQYWDMNNQTGRYRYGYLNNHYY